MPQSAEMLVSPSAERMHCMEVWGGNHSTNKHFQMAGLDTWIVSQPYQGAEGGGDVHYVSACASGRLTRILLADVSGHGTSAAKIGVALRDLMRRHVNVVRQDRLVRQMNEEFTKATAPDRFATAVVGSFFAPTKTLELCNAGHPVPLIYRTQDRCWKTIEQTEGVSNQIRDIPLGIYEAANYSKKKLRLRMDDFVLFYSDALIESVAPDGNQIGVEGVVNLLSRLDAADPALLISDLCAAIKELNSKNLDKDDLTIVLMKVTKTTSTITDNLLAPFRLFRKARVQTRISRS